MSRPRASGTVSVVDHDPTAGEANRTIQVDALADVELLDQDESAESDAPPPLGPAAAPPPLPYRRPSVIILVVVVLLAGALGAAGAYLIPSTEPEVVAAPAPAEAAAPAAPEAPPEEEVVRHVPLDEAFIIRFDEDAGSPPSE